MRVLDPFEVAEVEMWPFWDIEGLPVGDVLDRAEFTVYQRALKKSQFFAVLNEGEITRTELIDLPPSVRGAILPAEDRQSREHPDLRLAPAERTPSPISHGSSANVRSSSAYAERCGCSLDDSNIWPEHGWRNWEESMMTRTSWTVARSSRRRNVLPCSSWRALVNRCRNQALT